MSVHNVPIAVAAYFRSERRTNEYVSVNMPDSIGLSGGEEFILSQISTTREWLFKRRTTGNGSPDAIAFPNKDTTTSARFPISLRVSSSACARLHKLHGGKAFGRTICKASIGGDGTLKIELPEILAQPMMRSTKAEREARKEAATAKPAEVAVALAPAPTILVLFGVSDRAFNVPVDAALEQMVQWAEYSVKR